MAVSLIAKIEPQNNGFTGLVDAKQIIGGASNTIPDAAIAASNVTQHTASIDHNALLNTHNLTSDIDHTLISNIGTNTHASIDSHIADATLHFTAASLNLSNYLLTTDIDDVPVDGVTNAPISSNWAYDHTAASDPHAQYALLAGRSGGQTLHGGFEEGNNLTLRASSHANMGLLDAYASQINLETADGYRLVIKAGDILNAQLTDDSGTPLYLQYANGANLICCLSDTGKVGIGILDPLYRLDVSGDCRISDTVNLTSLTASKLVATDVNKNLVSVEQSSIDHNSLSGLTTNDPHTQYALLASTRGAQTFAGAITVKGSFSVGAFSNTYLSRYVYINDYDGDTHGNVRMIARDGNLNFFTGGLVLGTFANGSSPFIDGTGKLYAHNQIITPQVYGGYLAGHDLTLSSTTNATKGNIFFGTSTYDEVNNRLGIGTTTPQNKLHVKGSGAKFCMEGTTEAYMTWYPQGLASGRKGWIGFSGLGNTNLCVSSEGGPLELRSNGSIQAFNNMAVTGNEIAVLNTSSTQQTAIKFYNGNGTAEWLNGIKTGANWNLWKRVAATDTIYATMNAIGCLGIGGDVSNSNYVLNVQRDWSNGYVARFFNDGGYAACHGIAIQGGADDGSGITYYLRALDGDGGAVGYIENNAGVFRLVDVSDEASKDNIAPSKVDGLAVLNQIDTYEFSYKKHKKEKADHSIGFIAQQLQEVFPEAVSTDEDGQLGVSKADLIPLLVDAVKQLSKRVKELEARNVT